MPSSTKPPTLSRQDAWYVDLMSKSDEVIELEMEIARLNIQNAELHLFALDVIKKHRQQQERFKQIIQKLSAQSKT